jgi:hypothetical protein
MLPPWPYLSHLSFVWSSSPIGAEIKAASGGQNLSCKKGFGGVKGQSPLRSLNE